jgi:hypothetical protein
LFIKVNRPSRPARFHLFPGDFALRIRIAIRSAKEKRHSAPSQQTQRKREIMDPGNTFVRVQVRVHVFRQVAQVFPQCASLFTFALIQRLTRVDANRICCSILIYPSFIRIGSQNRQLSRCLMITLISDLAIKFVRKSVTR